MQGIQNIDDNPNLFKPKSREKSGKGIKTGKGKKTEKGRTKSTSTKGTSTKKKKSTETTTTTTTATTTSTKATLPKRRKKKKISRNEIHTAAVASDDERTLRSESVLVPSKYFVSPLHRQIWLRCQKYNIPAKHCFKPKYFVVPN